MVLYIIYLVFFAIMDIQYSFRYNGRIKIRGYDQVDEPIVELEIFVSKIEKMKSLTVTGRIATKKANCPMAVKIRDRPLTTPL